MEALRELHLLSPLFLFLFAPLVYVTVFGLRLPFRSRGTKHRGMVSFSSVDTFEGVGKRRVLVARYGKNTAVFLIAAALILLLAEPSYQRTHGATLVQHEEQFKTLVVAFDTSISMTYSLSSGNPETNNKGTTRFEASRDALLVFLEQAQDVRVGVVFFSDVTFQYRRPTKNIDALRYDLSQLVLDEKKLPEERSFGRGQFSYLKSGTNIGQAVEFSGNILTTVDASRPTTKALVLVTDLDTGYRGERALREEIEGLARQGIRVFVFSIGRELAFQEELNEAELVDVFTVVSEEDLRRSFAVVSQMEGERVVTYERTTRDEVEPLTPKIARTMIFGLMLFAFAAEVFARKVR